MRLAQVLSAYFNLNLLILVAGASLYIISKLFKVIAIKSKTELSLNYAALSLVLAFSVVHAVLPKNEIFKPAAKIWSGESGKNFSRGAAETESHGYLMVPGFAGSLAADRVTDWWVFILAALLLVGGSLMIRDLRVLFRFRQRSFLIRKVGQIRIYVNDEIQVPFSYWWPWQSHVVVPSNLLALKDDYKMAVSHELQHHRQGDTRWVYVLWGLRLICFINPFIHLWTRWISELQEFACDETLVDRNKVESRAYARCLVEVAQNAIHHRQCLVSATGLTFLVESHILKRRIEKMFSEKVFRKGRAVGIACGLSLASLMAATAVASKNFVQDRRVSMAQAVALVQKAQGTSRFPVVMNELVLKELNRYVGTPDGREFMRNSLLRMEKYRGMIEGKIHAYGLPMELLAIPIIESGYQNLPESNKQGWGAGLWMFIAPTARAFGLRVDTQVDERMNVEKLTDAAMRYLQANYLRFQDWHLATLAYNVGENNLQGAIDKVGSRSAWELLRKGYENDHDYLPCVMAAIIIMQNPEMLK